MLCEVVIKTSKVSWQALTKVPKITAIFWVIKILTTAMGESTSDALVNDVGPAVAVAVALIALLVALKLQFKSPKYTPRTYWFAVSMVAVFGTMAADGIHIAGVPYILSSSLYAVALAIIFWLWYRREKTLSIHSVYTKRREQYYWLTVLATFALGTALGDLSATTFNLGYWKAGLMFGLIIAVPAIGYWLTKTKEVFFFWFAYVMTRPLGASFADWFGKPKNIGGLNLGDTRVAIVLAALIIILVSYLQITGKDSQTAVKADDIK